MATPCQRLTPAGNVASESMRTGSPPPRQSAACAFELVTVVSVYPTTSPLAFTARATPKESPRNLARTRTSPPLQSSGCRSALLFGMVLPSPAMAPLADCHQALLGPPTPSSAIMLPSCQTKALVVGESRPVYDQPTMVPSAATCVAELVVPPKVPRSRRLLAPEVQRNA